MRKSPTSSYKQGVLTTYAYLSYERVFLRISRLSSRKRGIVKRLLGWIGSSPVPLTIHELEQAILVSSRAHDDAPSVDSPLNIVKLCGPIVEIMDGTPQFVHSTVKERVITIPQHR